MPSCARCGFESGQAVRFCPECGAEQTPGSPTGEQRRIVTVLFCDLTGSTALGESLDPERLRALLARYFERMQGIVEHHGGTVEKFIGDAVMAVFGVPVVHEDDALRAVRAAVEMRDALPELELQGRIGVMTGEVVTGTAERLVTGDPVNVAARLEAAAAPGTVLIGQPTLALVHETVQIEPVEPLTLKGKTAPVPAFELLRVLDTPERRHDAPFVGRERELALFLESWERVQTERRCELITIVGDAGIGKSRLVVELLAAIDATVVRGRCLPYGEGITYWPIVEVLKQLDTLPPDDVAAAAIRSLLGQSDAATSAEEIAWAFRKTLEHAASTRPLVVVLDDIQWGEETFRDLIEHVALLSSGAPILLVCMARPELIEQHPTWPVTFRLAPLDADEIDELIADRIPGDLGARIAHAAGGNPLFIEEMLAMAVEGDSEVVVPPTLHALLAARLDQLEAPERNVLEWGAIEGETFHRGSVQALAPDETQITPRLASLVRKQFLRPETALLPGEDGFRFRHLLVREAAYETLSKATRADLHERFAQWLERHGRGLVERDEIIGYHLEQAWHYRTELGLLPDDDLGTAARLRLGLGGHRAQARSDYNAAVNLLERALALVPPPAIDLALEARLIDALFWAGRGGDAIGRAESLIERASAAGNLVGELCGAIQVGIVRCFLEPEGESERLRVVVEHALPTLEAAGDHVALYIAYQAVGQVANTSALVDQARDAYDRAASHAWHAGLPDSLLGWRSAFRFAGTTPVPEVLAWLDANEPREGRNHWLRARRAGALAMLGCSEEARAIVAETRAELAERGSTFKRASLFMEFAELFLWIGDPAAAVELGAEACRLFDEQTEKSMLSTTAGQLARALLALGRLDEAEIWALRAEELGASDDAWTQFLWRQVTALVLARRGRHAEAASLGHEAVAWCEETELLDAQGDAYADLAEVLVLGGKRGQAAAALEQALDRYERKGNLVSARRARARLAELVQAT